MQTLAAVLFNEKDTIYDIFYVRKIIEPHVAELAAENATLGEIKELATLIMEHEESIAEGKSVTKYDSAFHGLLARMSKNPIMERLLSALVDLFEQTRGEYLQNDERAKKSFIGHHEVFTAIKSRDCTAARRAMSRHLEKVEMIVMGKKRKGGGRH